MTSEDIIRNLSENGIEIFETTTGLDDDFDILLKGENTDEFIRFCNLTNNRIAFLKLYFFELEDYIVDVNTIYETIQEIIAAEYSYDIEYILNTFKKEVDAKLREVNIHNSNVTSKLSILSEAEIMRVDIYIAYNGVNAGICLFNNYMNDFPMTYTIENDLRIYFEKLFSSNSSINILSTEENCYSSPHEDLLKHREHEEKLRQNAIIEIERMLEDDISLFACTNQRLRHAYAKKIAMEYSKKYNIKISICDIETIVDEIYMKSK